MIGRVVLSALLMTSSAAAFAADSSGDSVSGKAIFQHICQNCHSTEIGINKVGPTLWSVVGRQPASVPDYTYSEAMKANKSAWTTVALDAYPRRSARGRSRRENVLQGIAGVQGSRRRHRLFNNPEIDRVKSLSNGRGRQSRASMDFMHCLHLSVD